MKRLIQFVILFAAVQVMHAQVSEQIQRATISGSRGTSGKCTIEVRVDIAAEIDIYGDSGRLRTLAGQPATWTRFDCTDALPYNMSDFRFRGVDGRGSAKLAQDPRNNNSMAVIRIDDPRSGAEGYTFEIEWSGASGGSPTGGFSTGGMTNPNAPGTGNLGGYGMRRGAPRMSAERSIDLCRTEVRARAERDYGLTNMDITSAAVDTSQTRRGWITGGFRATTRDSRRGAPYRFACEIDNNAAQVRTVEIQRADGSVIQPGTTSTNVGGWGTPTTATTNTGSYDQTKVFRACQDAVATRANRDGYESLRFGSTAVDNRRSDWVSGSITAVRGPVTDTFDFGCAMDFRSAQVRNVELNRR